jgi:hypothetical protein
MAWTIGDGTPVALLVQTRPLSHPLRAVLNTPRVAIRPAPGGTFSIDADWAADEGIRRGANARVRDRPFAVVDDTSRRGRRR